MMEMCVSGTDMTNVHDEVRSGRLDVISEKLTQKTLYYWRTLLKFSSNILNKPWHTPAYSRSTMTRMVMCSETHCEW